MQVENDLPLCVLIRAVSTLKLLIYRLIGKSVKTDVLYSENSSQLFNEEQTCRLKFEAQKI